MDNKRRKKLVIDDTKWVVTKKMDSLTKTGLKSALLWKTTTQLNTKPCVFTLLCAVHQYLFFSTSYCTESLNSNLVFHSFPMVKHKYCGAWPWSTDSEVRTQRPGRQQCTWKYFKHALTSTIFGNYAPNHTSPKWTQSFCLSHLHFSTL